MTTKIQVAIDGPASAGKSTIAKIIATQLGYIYVDTGAMYRTITLAAIRANLIQVGQTTVDEKVISDLLDNVQIGFAPSEDGQLVFLNETDITEDIRQADVNSLVSLIAAIPAVRTDLVERQRQLAATSSVVMDGRDIGTTVLPNAQVKIFLVASVAERAQRRFAENQAKGIDTDLTLAKIEESIARRDYLDSHREVSPLKQADDAVLVDTTGLSIAEVVTEITNLIHKKIG
ncbi:(d)CMP kinase [Periweissella ghanensis]|uniref:Cytidylate kinase n=1 Tax=Periweissella ghanensis TaxID=467997 RepID=A0ABN8BNC3_9LACO|nr:(d)CMP kinase [Periweissella ghanensis]MCM0600907.1 (d)CMP kinase [Periweissella ghanensis]CAH0417675.1 Cytidylate kinase [Periweissella ghanensis]